MSWTEETEARAIRLAGEGFSASMIATHLGNGTTRNAVIGKLYRLGLGTSPPRTPKRARRHKRCNGAIPPAPRGQTASLSSPEARLATPLPNEPDPPPGKRVSLADLKPHQCRFVLGHVGDEDFGFCGRKRHGRLPYCPTHARRVVGHFDCGGVGLLGGR